MKFWGKITKFRHEIFHDFSGFQSGTRILEKNGSRILEIRTYADWERDTEQEA